MMSRERIEEGHTLAGRWILVPVADITTPKPGRLCYAPRWWAVTADNEVLFFDSYSAPQCSSYKDLVARLGRGFGAPATTPKFIEMAFLPHRCSDYA